MFCQRRPHRMMFTPGRTPLFDRLYRSSSRGKIAGVCAGLADYLNIQPFVIRLGVAFAFFVAMPVTLVAYIAAAAILPARPDPVQPPGTGHPGQTVWGQNPWAPPAAHAETPAQTLQGLRDRLRTAEKRVVNLEAYVATTEFELNRAIRNLDP